MADVIELKPVTLGENAVLEVNHILETAKDEIIETVIIIGRHKDGGLYFSSTHGNERTLFYLEKAKGILLGFLDDDG